MSARVDRSSTWAELVRMPPAPRGGKDHKLSALLAQAGRRSLETQVDQAIIEGAVPEINQLFDQGILALPSTRND